MIVMSVFIMGILLTQEPGCILTLSVFVVIVVILTVILVSDLCLYLAVNIFNEFFVNKLSLMSC